MNNTYPHGVGQVLPPRWWNFTPRIPCPRCFQGDKGCQLGHGLGPRGVDLARCEYDRRNLVCRRAPEHVVGPDTLHRLFTALYEPDDPVLIRLVGATEVDSFVWHLRFRARELAGEIDPWLQCMEIAQERNANVYFRVHPTFRGDGRYDYAFQTRVVRCLYADFDHAKPGEADRICLAAGLP